MKIIKDGLKHENYPIEHTCPVCGCVYEYDENDIHATDERDGVYFGVVFCPTCKNSYHVTCTKEVWENSWEVMIARDILSALIDLKNKGGLE